MWQDYVFTVGTVVFAIGLIPTLKFKKYPSLSTCFTTACVMCAYSIANATLGLWLTSLSVAVTCGLWLYMALAQLKQ